MYECVVNILQWFEPLMRRWRNVCPMYFWRVTAPRGFLPLDVQAWTETVKTPSDRRRFAPTAAQFGKLEVVRGRSSFFA